MMFNSRARFTLNFPLTFLNTEIEFVSLSWSWVSLVKRLFIPVYGQFARNRYLFTVTLKPYPIGNLRTVVVSTLPMVWVVGVVDVTYKL